MVTTQYGMREKLQTYQIFYVTRFFATPSCQDNNGQPKPTSPCEMEPVCLTPESDPIPGIEFDQNRERYHSYKYLLTQESKNNSF